MDADALGNAVFAAYAIVDDALRAGRYHLVDQLLGCVDAESAPLELVLGYLSSTHPAWEHLPSRWGFFKRVRHRILRERGAEATSALMRGLQTP